MYRCRARVGCSIVVNVGPVLGGCYALVWGRWGLTARFGFGSVLFFSLIDSDAH
jgi:hypothetical protein